MTDTERPNTGSFNLEFVSAECQPHDRSASNECQRLGSMLEVGPWLKDKHQRRDVIFTLFQIPFDLQPAHYWSHKLLIMHRVVFQSSHKIVSDVKNCNMCCNVISKVNVCES